MFHTRRESQALAAFVVVLSLAFAACGGDKPSSPTAPTPTTSSNQAPQASGLIPAQELTVGAAAGMVDVAQYFSNPAGDALTYAADSNDAGTVTASVSGSMLTLTPVAAGMATVTVTARDPGGLSATQTIDVTVLEIPDSRITETFFEIDGSRPNAEGGIFGGGGPTQQVRLHVGDEIILVVRVRCDDGELYTAGRFDAPCFTGNDEVTWRSSDQAVAVVTLGYADGRATDSAGIVQGVGAGPVTITTRFKGHVASVPVEVVSDTATGDRSTMDRPDDISGPQIHFVYAVPVGGNDRGYDRTGDMTVVANLMHTWLQAEAGMTWRLDTYNGQVDVSFLPIQWTGARYAGLIFDAFANALETQPGRQLHPQKTYAVFFDYDGLSQGEFPINGVAGRLGQSWMAITLIPGPFHEQIAGTAIHEIIHTFGAVASCAPNANAAFHVDDSRLDIMGGGDFIGGVLDWGRDDYFQHGRAGCLDIAVNNPYWAPAPGGSTARPLSRRVGASWSIRLRCGGVIR